MPHLLYEVRIGHSVEWKPLGRIHPTDPPETITDTTYERGDLILFACAERVSVVSRAIDAIGAALEYGRMRAVLIGSKEGILPLARLSHRESYELELRSREGIRYIARWTHHD